MPGIYLSEEELAALMGAPALVQRLYVFGIRPSMDFGTGMVGEHTKVSWHGLARELRVESAPGIKEELPSKEQVRRAAQHLVKRGLLVEKSQGLRLILQCPMARLNSSAQKKADIKPTDLGARKPTDQLDDQDTEIKEKITNSEGKTDMEADTPENDKPTHIGVSEFKTSSSRAPDSPAADQAASSADDFDFDALFNQHEQQAADRRRKFPMHWEWQPSPQFAERCRQANVVLSRFPRQQQEAILGEFRSHWESQGAEYNQGEWEHKLVRNLQHVGASRYGQQGPAPDLTQSPKARRAAVTESVMDIGDTDW